MAIEVDAPVSVASATAGGGAGLEDREFRRIMLVPIEGYSLDSMFRGVEKLKGKTNM